MQKLKQRTKKNTPRNAPQVSGNCGLSLNREETLSVTDLKTCFNNPEVDQPQHTAGLKAKKYVFVRSIDGKQLMPCKPAKAKHLLKNKKAKVVKLYPFTIQLNFVCENQVQDVELGIDGGYKNIGFSTVTEKREVFSGTLELDGKTSARLTEKRMHRSNRRNKKTWYRQPRFLNRKKTSGWIPPSTQRRYNTHLKLINLVKSILPITKITIETGNFDIQKIMNPEISGIEYQKGDMYGYQNMRAYLMARENGLCQICKKKFTSVDPAHIHHCKERSEEGTNRAKNLGLVHKSCHKKLHKKGLKISAPKQYKAQTFMSIVHNRFKKDSPDINITFGYKTFIDRNNLGLEKTHYNDAFVIAGGKNQDRCGSITIKQKHRNNRSIQRCRTGYKPAIRKCRYKTQPKDLIWINGKKYIVISIQNKGKYVRVENSKKVIPTKNIEKIYNFGGLVYN